ncbi:hypothetical protein MTO96_019214 [Rhipicephalus appendiculatus]
MLPHKDALWADQAIKSEFLSVEKLLIQTIHIRTKQRLSDLRDRLKSFLGSSIECPIQGSPAVLQVPLLQPCMQSENLLVTVDTHTGYFLAFVPQYSILWCQLEDLKFPFLAITMKQASSH